MVLKIKRYPFYVGITTLIVVIVMILTGLFMFISHSASQTAAWEVADRLFTEISAKTLGPYESALKAVAVLAGAVGRMPDLAAARAGAGPAHPGMDLMMGALAYFDYVFSTYFGYPDGSFIEIIAVRDQLPLRLSFNAPPGTYYVLRTIAADVRGTRVQRWYYFNRERSAIGERSEPDPAYDPRRRPWYTRARQAAGVIYTEPYVFSSTQAPGITCGRKLADGGGVFGVDITLERFAASLKRQQVSANGLMLLLDRAGRIILDPRTGPIQANAQGELDFMRLTDAHDPLVRAVATASRNHPDRILDHTHQVRVGKTAYFTRATELEADLGFGQVLVAVAPVTDFTGHIRRMQNRVFWSTGLVLLLVLPLSLLVSYKISGNLMLLEKESRKIQQRDFSESPPFDSAIKEIHSLIQAFFLMKRTIRRLLDQKRKLFDDFTKLIAGAIDAKSPYTGGHCARVPRLAEMLAAAVCREKEGVFADFDMPTEDERWEFEVAAWLHDCGKVTTPEYVVDKATKLETIYNRIHEVRMRFEVLLRDAELATYRQRLAGDSDEAALMTELEQRRKQIADDFAFVAACNIGGEFMADEKIRRLEQIAAQTWVRRLDDRLGISQDEAALKGQTPAPDLPVTEQLLADKPEHIIPRANPEALADNPHGFKLRVPENQYNLGELYNLGIRKGTLSAEDRFKINEHIMQTIIMLNKLEYPDYLARVPEFAGAHHETMLGTGYPRGLKKEEMSVPARIMAIADIFEALTAADRPYKKAKTLSQALRIMGFMRDDQHIDADLFDIFLKRGIYRQYADRYLAPEQIDTVDIRQYLAKPVS